MRHRLLVMLAVVLCLLFLATAITSAVAAEKYALAYWRELGKNEVTKIQSGWYPTEAWNNNVSHKIYVRVFDENGIGVSGKTVNWPTGTVSATDSKGIAIPIDHNNMAVFDGNVITMSEPFTTSPASDVSPLMAGRRYNNGTYVGWPTDHNAEAYWSSGYELGFLKLASDTNPGTFDTTLKDGVAVNSSINYGGTEVNTAPYTNSLAYSSTKANDSTTDLEHQGIGPNIAQPSYGQTFKANGDRVVAIEVRTLVSFDTSFRLNCQVFKCDGSGNPTNVPVSEIKRLTGVDGNVTKSVFYFGVNDCPVVSGQKYYYKIWSDNLNIQTYVVGNNYADGQAYAGGVAQPSYDLVGFVCCMTYGTTNLGNISGIVKDDSGALLRSALVTLSSAGTAVRSTYTDANGAYSFLNLAAGPYTIDAARALNYDGAGVVTVVSGTTATAADIVCKAAANVVVDASFENVPATGAPGFNNPLVSPWVQTAGGFYWCQEGRPWPHEGFGESGFDGTVYAGGSMQGGVEKTGMGYQIVTGLTSGKEYTASAFIRTTMKQVSEKPENLWCKIGVDAAGGTDFNAATWSAPQYPFFQWQFVKQNFIAAGPTATIYLSYDIFGGGGNSFVFAEFDKVGVYLAGITTAGDLDAALKADDNTPVYLPNMLITAGNGGTVPTFTNAFYIEDANRATAIRVDTTSAVTHPTAGIKQYVGEQYTIEGMMSTNSEGERVLNATNITWVNEGQIIPEPLFLTNRDLGGSNLNINTKGVYNGKGLYNVGKLVKVSGKVTYRGSGFFYIDDGSNLYDGNGVTTATGIRIDTTGLTNPSQNYAVVTGISTMKKIGTNSVRMVRPINSGNIVGY